MEEIQPPQYQEHRIEAAGVFPASDNAATTSKRQRRPSVRLGEIGDQPAATLFQESHRRPKHWKPIGGKDQTGNGGKSSKIRQLDKLSGGSYQQEETLDLIEGESRELNLDNLAIGSWRTKDSNNSKRVAKKPRTNWHPKFPDGGGGGFRNAEDDSKSARGDDDDETDELSKEQLGLGGSQLRRSHHSSSRVRVEEETNLHGEDDDDDDDDDLDGPLETNQKDVGSQDGVKNWLEGLGLRRYWPVFEIHEVDEEVLPLLTLDDLKDMGINAVGSRRKMFGAIQKLRKGFS